MSNQLEKFQMLYDLERSLIFDEIKTQKQSVYFVALIGLFAGVALIGVNVAIYLHFSELHAYAEKAWWMVGINLGLAVIPLLKLTSKPEKSNAEEAAIAMRDALLADIKQNAESTAMDLKQNIDKIQGLATDIKAIGEGGLNAVAPLVKLAAEFTSKKIRSGTEH